MNRVIVGTVVGWFLGLFSKPIADCINVFWRGPRLTLKVEEAPHEFQFDGYKEVYVNVEVSNDKPRTAENTRAWLVNIEKRAGDKFEATEFSDSFPLIWAYDATVESAPIPKGVVRRVNVVTLRSDKNGFTPRLRDTNGNILAPTQYQQLFNDSGAFRFTVLVSAEDAPSRTIKVVAERNNGQWPPKVWVSA